MRILYSFLLLVVLCGLTACSNPETPPLIVPPPITPPVNPPSSADILAKFEQGVHAEIAALDAEASSPGGTVNPYVFLKALVLPDGTDTVKVYFKTSAKTGTNCTLNWNDGSSEPLGTAPFSTVKTLIHKYTLSKAVTLTATCTQNGLSVLTSSVTLTVKGQPIPCAVTGVTVSGASSVNQGQTTQLTATVNQGPEGCVSDVSQAVTWTSSDPSLAKVDSSGLVTGVKLSSTGVVITAISSVDPKQQGIKKLITAIPCVATGITVSGASSVNPGETTQLAAKVNKGPEGCAGEVSQAVIWTSSDPTIATVSTTGLVVGVKLSRNGVTITATSGADSNLMNNKAIAVGASCTVRSVSVSGTSSINQGAMAQFTAVVNTGPVGCVGQVSQLVTWASSDPGIAKVDQNGKVTGVGFSSSVVTITATSSADPRLSDSQSLRVLTPCVVTGVTVNGASSLSQSLTTQLTATVNKGPTGCSGEVSQAVTWASSDPGTATLDSSGLVKRVKFSATPVVVTATSSADPKFKGSKTLSVSFPGWSQVSSGEKHTCAVSSGSVYCWGQGAYGQLGTGNLLNSSIPVKVESGTDGFQNTGVSSVSSGTYHTCAVSSGRVYCWGNNDFEQLGNGSKLFSSTPVLVSSGTDGFQNTGVSSVSSGYGHTCVLSNGSVYCWGLGGAIGAGFKYSSSTPVKVISLNGIGFHNTNVSSFSSGYTHTCAVSNGSMYCWGGDGNGQLGTGYYASSGFPVQVTSVANGFQNSGVDNISSGSFHTCAVSNGSVYCWGTNTSGELGSIDTGISSSTAVKVSSVANGFQNSRVDSVSSGNNNTCASSQGSVYCWGNNDFDQLGNGAKTSSSTPVKVLDPIN